MENKRIDGTTRWSQDCVLLSAGEEMGNSSDIEVRVAHNKIIYTGNW